MSVPSALATPSTTERKRFSLQLKLNYGDAAEHAVLDFLTQRLGRSRVQHEPLGQYGPDIMVIDNRGRGIYLDVERRGNWRSEQDSFPFETVHMPKRKLKFAELGKPYFYISVRDDCQKAILFTDRSIMGAVCVFCGNRYVAAGEEFVDLPVGEGSYLDLKVP